MEKITAYQSKNGKIFVKQKDWDLLKGYWERQETPPVTRYNWECKYCGYRAHCDPQ